VPLSGAEVAGDHLGSLLRWEAGTAHPPPLLGQPLPQHLARRQRLSAEALQTGLEFALEVRGASFAGSPARPRPRNRTCVSGASHARWGEQPRPSKVNRTQLPLPPVGGGRV
jgi:hypothetical protein